MNLTESLTARYWAKVDKHGPTPDHAPELGPCWPWLASCTSVGYGQIQTGRRGEGNVLAHHVALALAGRAMPEPGQHTDHLCRRRDCQNPDHLEVVSHGENIRRGRGVKLTHDLADHIRSDSRSSRQVAAELGVHHSRVVAIRQGKAWVRT